MSSTIVYQQLHTQSLLTVNFSSLTQNFRTIDKFIKDFSTFQRKLSDIQKIQKATSQDLTNFKISTQNTFSTLNDVLDSRSNLTSKGGDTQQLKQIKKSFTEIKKFVTENARDQHQAHQTKQQQQFQYKQQLQKKLQNSNKQIQSNQTKNRQLQSEIRQLKLKLSTKIQVQNVRHEVQQINRISHETNDQLIKIQQMLSRLKVEEFKILVDNIQNNFNFEVNQMKRKFKLKTDISDTVKLQQMILNMINFMYEHISKKLADKNQTKKALVFLQKRMNKTIQSVFGQQQGDKQALLATRGWKCISCTKDLGQLQGKLDKYKPWSIFPAKQPAIKDRYSGFGSGFQSVVETSINKKGIDVGYDDKGRMTTPYNLTRQVQTNLKPSQSQSKIQKQTSSTGFKPTLLNNTGSKNSPGKPIQMETTYMSLYGRHNQPDIDIKDQYTKKYNGLMAYIKISYEENMLETEK